MNVRGDFLGPSHGTITRAPNTLIHIGDVYLYSDAFALPHCIQIQ